MDGRPFTSCIAGSAPIRAVLGPHQQCSQAAAICKGLNPSDPSCSREIDSRVGPAETFGPTQFGRDVNRGDSFPSPPRLRIPTSLPNNRRTAPSLPFLMAKKKPGLRLPFSQSQPVETHLKPAAIIVSSRYLTASSEFEIHAWPKQIK